MKKITNWKDFITYGEVLEDNDIKESLLRIRIIKYNEKKYIHIMLKGECIELREVV